MFNEKTFEAVQDIFQEEREKNCRYISGEFKISAVDEKNYQCSYALYFCLTVSRRKRASFKIAELDRNVSV